jgi:hypothetical protein
MGWWWQPPVATVILSSNGAADVIDACYYCRSPINKPLRAHIAMLPKIPTKKFCGHMMSPAHCYFNQTHLSATQISMWSNKFELIV